MALSQASTRAPGRRGTDHIFAALAEHSDDVVWLIDDDGDYSYVSPPAQRVLGWKPEVLVGTRASLYVHPADRDRVVALRSALAGREPGSTITETYRRSRPDGSYMWVKHQATTVAGAPAAPSGLVGIVRSLSAGTEAQAALARSVQRHEEFIERAPVGIVEIDLGGRVIRANPVYARMLGSRPEELVGTPATALVHPDSVESRAAMFERLLHEPVEQTEGTIRYLHPDGRDVLAAVTASLLRDNEERPWAIVVLARDITEETRLQGELEALLRQRNATVLELERLSRLKSDFLHMISHELRTPLTAIRGFTELLLLDAEGQERESLSIVKRNAEGLTSLISDLLSLADIQAGDESPALAPLDLVPLVRAVARHVRRTARSKGLSVKAEMPAEAWAVAEQHRTRAALHHLASNAVKFTDSGEITMRCVEADGVVRIGVQDTGPGLTQAALGVIFEPFAQLHSGTTRRHGGAGIGLALTKHFVEAQGGRLVVESEPGCGSTFWLELPAGRPPRPGR